jgi:dihydrofolate synthase / folylpolyglutamate synthase
MVNIPHWPQISLWKVPRKTDLSTTFQLLEELGNPHKKLPPTIHIAGTNGKGSTLAMLENIFAQSGYSTHSYTSPHILEFNERIKLQGNSISDSHLRSILERTREAAENLKIIPSFFEGITCAAFLAFSETPADILFLETGLGGRLDCTNVLDDPTLTIITPISFDHVEYLGTTLREIATEKAGIIKKNTPCVIGSQTQEIYDILIEKCDEVGAPSFCYEYDYTCEKATNSFKYKSKNIDINMPTPSLTGEHQILNASMAIAAVTLLNNKFKINTNQIAQGLLTTSWPGRLQLIKQERTANIVNENIKIYIDGAHNDAGAICLSDWAKSRVNGPVYMILGMTNNRNVTSFCNHFKNIISSGVAVTIESEPSSYSASVLAKKANSSGILFVESNSLVDAIKHIASKNGQTPATIIITGSLFLVSDFFKLDELIYLD